MIGSFLLRPNPGCPKKMKEFEVLPDPRSEREPRSAAAPEPSRSSARLRTPRSRAPGPRPAGVLAVATLALLLLAPTTATGQSSRPASGPSTGQPANPTTKPATKPRPPQPPAAKPGEAREAGIAHILIAYVGSRGCPPTVTRNRSEARALALEVLLEARMPDADFAALVDQYSEDVRSIENDGRLGVFRRDRVPAGFEKVAERAFSVEEGETAPSVAESPMGYHIVRRIPIVRYYASHILIRYAGALRAPQGLTRTRGDAFQRAMKAYEAAAKDPSKFPSLVLRYSDGDPSNRGFLEFVTGQLPPAFEQAVAKLSPGQISRPVETPLGFHVIRGEAAPPLLRASHILIGFAPEGAEGGRTRAEAVEMAQRALATLQKSPDRFGEIAKTISDDVETRASGGDLGRFRASEAIPAFRSTIEGLSIGGVSKIIETRFGFHILKRTE